MTINWAGINKNIYAILVLTLIVVGLCIVFVVGYGIYWDSLVISVEFTGRRLLMVAPETNSIVANLKPQPLTNRIAESNFTK